MERSPIRVLVVDDDEDDFLIVRDLLGDVAEQPYDAVWAASFDDGLRRMAGDAHDVCLVDFRLGARDGLDLIRESRRRGDRIPIVLLTGRDDRAVDLQAMEAGASEFLVKGQIQPSLLERTIRYAIGHKRAEEALQRVNLQLESKVAELERCAREIGLLGQLGNYLQSVRSIDEAGAVVASHASRLFPSLAGALCITRPSRDRVDAVASWGDVPGGDPTFPPEACWALRHGRPHLVTPPRLELVCPHAKSAAPAPSLCVPLMAQDAVLGLFTLRSAPDAAAGPPESAAPFAEPQQRLAFAFSEQVALSLANLRLRETLREQAIRDPLTSLFNRRYLEESLAREIQRGLRRGSPVCVVMADVDHFKPFNDSHGHAAGDVLLRDLGALLRRRVRGEDVACRYGGDEFSLILPDAAPQDILNRLNQIREEAKQTPIDYRGRLLGGVTLSMGLAAFPAHGATVEVLLRAADAALYAAKARGRNQVVVADVPAPAGAPPSEGAPHA